MDKNLNEFIQKHSNLRKYIMTNYNAMNKIRLTSKMKKFPYNMLEKNEEDYEVIMKQATAYRVIPE